jgi:hypothetical protein
MLPYLFHHELTNNSSPPSSSAAEVPIKRKQAKQLLVSFDDARRKPESRMMHLVAVLEVEEDTVCARGLSF